MNHSCLHRLMALLVFILVAIGANDRVTAAELVRLAPETWDKYAPQGKEVDAIYGDYLLRNDKIVVVIANPIPTRHANMTVRDVGGSIIDLTRVSRQNDQLSCYYPESRRYPLELKELFGEAPDEQGKLARTTHKSDGAKALQIRQPTVGLICQAAADSGKPAVEVTYTLKDGWDHVLVETRYANPHDKPLEVQLIDSLRADRSFEKAPAEQRDWYWVHDVYWQQAYGVLPDGREVRSGTDSGARSATVLRYFHQENNLATIEPGDDSRWRRRIFPADHLLSAKAIAQRLLDVEQARVELVVQDKAARRISGASVTLLQGKEHYGEGKTDDDGKLSFDAPAGTYEVRVEAQGREAKTLSIEVGAEQQVIEMTDAGYVLAEITDEDGEPLPCKVQFRGRDGLADPSFGPDTAEYAVHNLYYSENGRFRQPLAPGGYDVIISYGPEYDAVFTKIETARGRETALRAKLVKSVDTRGWISADFHNHSSPSGDNTASQLGRVLNLLCEHVEFAPCTEHNRIDTYVPHLKRLKVEHLLATCTGMELTGQPLPINHHNAFPLVHKPRTQDGGGPTTDVDPAVQIARLALWDNRSDKLVQQNHPDLGHLFFDKNGDGVPDEGFKDAFGHMDVMEVHPLDNLLKPAVNEVRGQPRNNTIVNWLQLVNRGQRIPGVVNTDAHYNFHGSGFLRNFLKSKTDDPAKIETMDIVHAAERGNVIMTTGPFLEVSMKVPGGEKTVTAGDDLAASGGKVLLSVRVQCPNWFDVDRVQVYLNGRPDELLNFTRATSDRFSDETVKFDEELELQLKRDTHVLVAAMGERSTLGDVMGPTVGKIMPIAVSNPIYVDVDGNGFQPNGDTLGQPLPVKAGAKPANATSPSN
jgi:hypothetical protein